MQTEDIQALNDNYAIGNHITFAAGPGRLPIAQIRNSYAAATVSIHGGHVVAFQPHAQAPALWVSSQSVYAPGKAIRGGIPVCWPWFGPHPTDPTKPAHGFVRTAMWSILATAVVHDNRTQIRLRLRDDETRTLWPHAFDLRIVITVGPELQVELIARNPGNQPFTCGGALHSYFSVSDARAIAIHGLDGCAYIDKVDGELRKIQRGPVTIAAETDRVYLDTTGTCTIDDPGLGRRIQIAKAGSQSTVVWNPWIEKARRLPDFGDQEYLGMVCVETANAGADVATVAPGGEHRLITTISVEANSAD
jgi:glucose-6-phosphate 1-epimerase